MKIRTGGHFWSFKKAFDSYKFRDNVVDVVAIDHLPTLFPKESSEEFTNDLTPVLESYFLSEYEAKTKKYHPIIRALEIFEKEKQQVIN